MARTSSSNPSPIITSRSSSLEKVPQLVGQLNSDGIASLEANDSHASTNSGPSRSLKASLETNIDYTKDHSTDVSSESTSEEDEDYDSLRHDPMAIVDGGKGGGYSDEKSSTSNSSYEELKTPKLQPRPNPSRLKSIAVTLNKLKENGRYVLTADDDALRELLKISVEREKNPSAKRRSKFSDLVFTRRFTAFDSQNSESAGSPFRGFFNLFWLGTAIFMIRIAAENWRQHGSILGTNEIMGLMFHRDVMVLGLSDGVMCAATGFSLILQKLIFKGVISWNKEGWIIQSIWEALFLVVGLAWTLIREWPWTHTVFFVLHCLVMLMKQHSYAFYNGHLSEGYKTREALRLKLKQLDNLSPSQSPSATTPSVSSLSTSYLEHRPTASDLNRRRQSQRSGSYESGAANISQVASAIESGEPLDLDQIQTFERIIQWEVDALTEDLKGKSTITGNFYPKNLTVANHYEYIVLPTLVYELEYPRMDHINWFYVAEKTVAVFGILIIMNMVSQAFIYPQVMLANRMKEDGMTLLERLKVFPWILSDLMFPFMMEYMMTWLLIWEEILNLLAELTYFADRGFYADWWNSTSWDAFARDWNSPVHNFLLRHVYHSSISSLKVNKYTATLITFFLSACVHELVMYSLFRKLRGYLLVLQMLQLPLVQLSRTKYLKNRKTLGNLIFWVGIFTGPSLLCSLYLII